MAKISELITTEKKGIPLLLGSLVAVTLSGLITYVFPENNIWQQWMYLMHTFTGLYLAIILAPYIVTHFLRTMGVRRPVILLTGIASVITAVIMIVTGIHITLFGQLEALRWIYSVHITSSALTIVGIISHLVLHWFLLPERRNQSGANKFPTLNITSARAIVIAPIAMIIVVGIASAIVSVIPNTYQDKPVISPYEYPYGKHPFRPSQTETITGGFMDVRRVGQSHRCAACHEDITKQWKSSMHAKAASDTAYQTNVNLLANTKGIAATRFCEGCHAPVALLSGELSKGGRLNTDGHLNEGVSCLSCHGIDKVVHLKGNASYRFSPAKDYLFADRSGWLANKLHNFLIRIQPRQHRTDMARPVLKNPQACATCHAGFMDKEINSWGWVKLLDEYSAWLNSPYSGTNTQTFKNKQIVRCHECHFPLEKISDPSSNQDGLARSHRSIAANTAIPFYDGDQEQLKLTTEFLQANKIRLSIDKPNRPDARRSGKPVAPELSATQETPSYFYLGETVDLNIVVTNQAIGHDFPGGTTDINEAWIHFRVVDAASRIVYESGQIDPQNNVEPKAYFYRSIAIDRHGKEVWKHDLFNMVGDSFKRTIPAGGVDIARFKFPVPTWAKGPLTASAVLRYRKFNHRYAKWALKDSSVRLPIVDMARDALSIPLRIRKEAVTN